MSVARVEKKIAVPPATIWPLLADFPRIDAFNPALSRSNHLDGTPESGLGAERKCVLKNERDWFDERVVDWRPGAGYTVEITRGTLPIHRIVTSLGVEPDGKGSRAHMEIRYEPKYGWFGRVLDRLILHRRMRRLMAIVLDGLADKAEARLAPEAERPAA